MPHPLRIGLTGGIACGKSQVLSRLTKAGFHTLDLDRVAHEVMAPLGAAHEEVVAAFGPGILDPEGAIDRQALGAVVFRDEGARQRLNRIVHPRVWDEEAKFVARWSDEAGSVVVTDAALLVESGLHLRFDRLVVVHCPPEVQIRRLMARGLDEDAARARLGAQMPTFEKRRYGHFEVITTGALEQTWAATDALAREIQALARRAWPQVTVPRDRALGCLGHGPQHGPRGLSPSRLLLEIAQRGGIAMEALKSLLWPPASGVWYRAARADESGPLPATLAGAIVLWQASRGVADEEALLAAMASVARLTHDTTSAIGNACVLALAMLQAAAAPSANVAPADRLARWRSKAERWAGGTFSDELELVLRAVDEHPRDVAEARAAAASGGANPDLAGALAGLRGARGEGLLPPEAEEAVDALLRVSDRPATG